MLSNREALEAIKKAKAFLEGKFDQGLSITDR